MTLLTARFTVRCIWRNGDVLVDVVGVVVTGPGVSSPTYDWVLC